MDSLIKDNVVFTILSERRLGPKLYAVFAEGRLEEFVPSRSVGSESICIILWWNKKYTYCFTFGQLNRAG